MNQKNIIPLILSTLAGALAALAVCAFFFFYYKPAQTAEKPKEFVEKEPTPTPKLPESMPIPEVEIKESDVLSLSIATVYKDFFPENSKCHQTYNEMFGDKDRVYSPSSPCRVTLTFNRDGSAEKNIVISRYDNPAGGSREVEKSAWKSKISDEQFQELTKIIVNNEAFKSWREGTMINVSNCSITVKHTKGSKTPMSNVGDGATAFLPMVEAFKKLDAKVDWKKVQ
jgi:hypothetical protein